MRTKRISIHNNIIGIGQKRFRVSSVRLIAAVCFTVGIWGGCDTLRFAPGEVQKQNAYLHHRTVQAASMRAQQETVSPVLQELTGQAQTQSEAILAYYGLPKTIPPLQTIEQILSPASRSVTENAHAAAIERPDPWDVADDMLELGIAVAGIVGGVCGTRVVSTLRTAREKSTALREVVRGNEVFKQANPESVNAFKKAQQGQSTTTSTLVASMK